MKTIRTLALLIILAASSALASDKLDSCVAIRPPRAEINGKSIWGEYFWQQNATLRVKFLGGSRGQQSEAWKRFQTIDKLINLSFVRVESGHSDIRVAFDQDAGHWSYVGTGNRSVPYYRATMNLALKAGIFGSGATEWSRVTLHEICHAIGMNHEHQHPLATIKWNKPAVYDYYSRTQGWSRAEIDYQVLNRSPKTPRFRGTAFDPASIMEYPIPKELTLDGFSVGWNSKFSPLDLTFLKQVYP